MHRQPPPAKNHVTYRPDIDGLRAIAVLAVVIFHAFPGVLSGGFVGVDVFFVISGYLISSIIFTHLDSGDFSFLNFYSRRIRRIFPALIMMLLACSVAGWVVMTAPDFNRLGQHLQGSAGFFSNFVLMRESGYFDGDAGTKPLLHLWSLAIEEQFYIVWPLVLWLVAKTRMPRTLTLAFFLTTFLVYTLCASHFPNALARLYYAPSSRFWELMCGALLASIAVRSNRLAPAQGLVQRFVSHRTTREGCAAAGLLMLIAGFITINGTSPFPDWSALLPTGGAMLLIGAGPDTHTNRLVLGNRLAIWLGLISYPLYLWHWPLLSFARIVHGDAPQFWLAIGLVVLAIILAWLTNILIEKPLRSWRHTHAVTFTLLVGLAAIGGFGRYVSLNNGLAARFGVPDLIVNPGRYICSEQSTTGRCTFGNPGAEKLIVIAGDSHAEQYTNALRIALGDQYRFISVTNGSCFMGQKILHPELGDQHDCSAALSALHSLRGQKIYALIRVQRWHGYAIDDAAQIKLAVEDAMTGYDLQPQKILILGATPDVDMECDIANYYLRPGDKKRTCQSFERIKQYVRNFEVATRAMPQRPDVYFIYPFDVVCPNGECQTISGRTAMFENTHHLTTDGAMKVVPLIADALTALR